MASTSSYGGSTSACASTEVTGRSQSPGSENPTIDPDNEPCRRCGAVPGTSEYGTVGDGFDGLCPSCADQLEDLEKGLLMTKTNIIKRLEMLLNRQLADARTERSRSTGPRILFAQDHDQNAEALQAAIELLKAAP